MKRLITALALAIGASLSAMALPITYSVNHIIGTGSIVGSIQTDGTIGTLSTANILDWTLSLASPNLAVPSPDVISASTGAWTIGGGAFDATATDLSFDWGAADGSYFYFQGASGSAWCAVAGPSPTCAGETTPSDGIYFGTTTSWAELRNPDTREVIATTAAAIPEPASILLVAGALLGLGLAGKRRSA